MRFLNSRRSISACGVRSACHDEGGEQHERRRASGRSTSGAPKPPDDADSARP